MTELTIRHAVEKVAFRLGLLESGFVTLARLFVELPLSIELLNTTTHDIADGRSMLRDGVGDFAGLHFPEFTEAVGINSPETCPICNHSKPEPLYEGQRVIATPITCDSCFKQVAVLAKFELQSTFTKLRVFFGRGQSDPFIDLRREHDILYHGLRCGGLNLTHTAIATQTSHTMAEVSEKLSYMGSQRFAKFGLTVSGDAVAYSFPDGLAYSSPQYRRTKNALSLAVADKRPASTRLTVKQPVPTIPKSPAEPTTASNETTQIQARARNRDDSNNSFRIVVKSRESESQANDSGRLKITLRPSNRIARVPDQPAPQAPATPLIATPEPVVHEDDSVDRFVNENFVDDVSQLRPDHPVPTSLESTPTEFSPIELGDSTPAQQNHEIDETDSLFTTNHQSSQDDFNLLVESQQLPNEAAFSDHHEASDAKNSHLSDVDLSPSDESNCSTEPTAGDVFGTPVD